MGTANTKASTILKITQNIRVKMKSGIADTQRFFSPSSLAPSPKSSKYLERSFALTALKFPFLSLVPRTLLSSKASSFPSWLFLYLPFSWPVLTKTQALQDVSAMQLSDKDFPILIDLSLAQSTLIPAIFLVTSLETLLTVSRRQSPPEVPATVPKYPRANRSTRQTWRSVLEKEPFEKKYWQNRQKAKTKSKVPTSDLLVILPVLEPVNPCQILLAP